MAASASVIPDAASSLSSSGGPSETGNKQENKPSYQDMYSKYQKSFLATNVSLNASFYIERQKMIERYNKYSKFEVGNHLRRFITSDKFWTTMSNALIAYDKVLKQ